MLLLKYTMYVKLANLRSTRIANNGEELRNSIP